jgi:hypothetical protein
MIGPECAADLPITLEASPFGIDQIASAIARLRHLNVLDANDT